MQSDFKLGDRVLILNHAIGCVDGLEQEHIEARGAMATVTRLHDGTVWVNNFMGLFVYHASELKRVDQ